MHSESANPAEAIRKEAAEPPAKMERCKTNVNPKPEAILKQLMETKVKIAEAKQTPMKETKMTGQRENS